jgi:hypothetical protein
MNNNNNIINKLRQQIQQLTNQNNVLKNNFEEIEQEHVDDYNRLQCAYYDLEKKYNVLNKKFTIINNKTNPPKTK